MSRSAVVHPTIRESIHLKDAKKGEDKTPVPKTDDEVEAERLNVRHRWQTLINSALCWPMDEVNEILLPREGYTSRVLSVNAMDGMWAVEMAKQFPHVEVLCVAKQVIRPSDIPSNCRFEELDIVKDDTTDLQGTFDVVHCTRTGEWLQPHRPFWDMLARLVKPGGLLLFVPCDRTIYDENKVVLKPAKAGDEPGTSSWWVRIEEESEQYAPYALDVPVATYVEDALSWMRNDPRLEGVKEKQVYLPFGWPGTENDDLEHREEIGRLIGITSVARNEAIKPVLLAGGMPSDLLDLCMKGCEADILLQQLKSYALWHFFVGRRRAE